MFQKLFKRYRFAICCVCSVTASLLSFVNPLLAGIMVNQAMTAFSLPNLAPYLVGMGAVNGTRILLRSSVAAILKGKPRSPIVWAQNRIGKWLWWLEPALHGWGLPGIALSRFGRYLTSRNLTVKGLPFGSTRPKTVKIWTLSIASSLVYLISDAIITFLSGLIYYFTESYILSMLPAVLIPAAAVIPWYTRKSQRLRSAQHMRHTTG